MSSQPSGNLSYRDHLSSEAMSESPRDGIYRTNHHRNGPASRVNGAAFHVDPEHAWYMPVKAVFDSLLAAVLLLLAAPFIAVAALLVVLTSRGPAIYRQTRMGKDGRTFTLFKLRTMVHNAEAGTGPVWASDNDSRITPLGRLLRRTHLDEFPQLVNVLLGHMSLVGPRPERPEFVAKLEWEIPSYRERLKVRPGITGLAQLNLPPDSDLQSVRRKLVHDLYYVRCVNPWLDARLLVLTAWGLLVESGKFAWNLVALPTQQEIECRFREAVAVSGRESAADAASIKTDVAAGPRPLRAT